MGVTKSPTPKINHLSDRSGEIYRVRLGGSGRQSLQQHPGGGQRGVPPHSSTKLAWWLGGVPPPDRSSTRQIQAGGGAPDDQRSNTKGGRYPPQRHSRTLSEVGGCSTGKSSRFVRACVRAVWLSSGIGYQKMLSALFPFPFLARRAFLFLFWAQGAFPFPFPPPPKPPIQLLLGLSVNIWICNFQGVEKWGSWKTCDLQFRLLPQTMFLHDCTLFVFTCLFPLRHFYNFRWKEKKLLVEI